MSNWNNPTLSQAYSSVLSALKDRDEDVAKQFDPAGGTISNLPEGAIRWNSVNGYWEKRDAAGAWAALATKYFIDVDKLDGQDGAYYRAWSNITGKPTTFTPSAHNHDDRYFTETEADGRFAGTLVTSGNSIKLRNVAGADLATITVPYATNAGDATTVNGKNVDQNLRVTDSVNFAGLTLSGSGTVQGALYVGAEGGGNSSIALWDDTSDTWRSLRWNNSMAVWQIEDSGGIMRQLFHTGHAPTWSEVTGKPTTFTPVTHDHDFGTM